jgi:hypothetical protein
VASTGGVVVGVGVGFFSCSKQSSELGLETGLEVRGVTVWLKEGRATGASCGAAVGGD